MSRILAFVPAYNCERQIGRTLAQFNGAMSRHVSEIIVVDNRSTDGTAAAAAAALPCLDGVRGRLLQNDANYGLGGSHKVAFNYALDHGYDHCLVFHGDDQGRVADILPWLEGAMLQGTDCLLGSRFMKGSRLVGYSALRTWGNKAFNVLYSAVARRRLSDLGSGLNLYATAALADRFYLRLADDLTFNYGMILASSARRWRMTFFPIEWREEDQRSNVKLLRHALNTARIAAAFFRDPQAFLTANHAARPDRQYTWKVLVDTAAPPRMHAS